MADVLAAEHRGLYAAAAGGVAAIARLPDLLRASSLASDWEYGERARQLGVHLLQVLRLGDVPAYPSAFTLCRTALEHLLLDELLLHASRYRQIIVDVDEAQFAAYQADLERGEEGWTVGVHRLERRPKNQMAIVREGINLTNPAGEVIGRLSPYYALLNEHDPLLGRKSDQRDDGIGDLESIRAYAERNERLYRRYLSWKAVKDNLVLNDLYTEQQVRRLDVHYRFLSMFVHATSPGYRPFGPDRGHDHYYGELVLLYVCWLAADEVDSFARYCANLDASDRSEVESLTDTAARTRAAGAHLWSPRGAPHDYDRWAEANRLGFARVRDESGLPAVKPAELLEEDVGYYDNPIRRLQDMHWSKTEVITGLTYTSPWPRPDAMYRSAAG